MKISMIILLSIFIYNPCYAINEIDYLLNSTNGCELEKKKYVKENFRDEDIDYIVEKILDIKLFELTNGNSLYNAKDIIDLYGYQGYERMKRRKDTFNKPYDYIVYNFYLKKKSKIEQFIFAASLLKDKRIVNEEYSKTAKIPKNTRLCDYMYDNMITWLNETLKCDFKLINRYKYNSMDYINRDNAIQMLIDYLNNNWNEIISEIDSYCKKNNINSNIEMDSEYNEIPVEILK